MRFLLYMRVCCTCLWCECDGFECEVCVYACVGAIAIVQEEVEGMSDAKSIIQQIIRDSLCNLVAEKTGNDLCTKEKPKEKPAQST